MIQQVRLNIRNRPQNISDFLKTDAKSAKLFKKSQKSKIQIFTVSLHFSRDHFKLKHTFIFGVLTFAISVRFLYKNRALTSVT